MNRGSADYRRAPARDAARSGRVPESDRPSRRPQPNDTGARPARRPTPGTDGRLRGAVALAVVFLGTLAGAAVDSFVGTGLGTITLGALVATTVVAALLVRRRDLLSLVVAPPLIFVAVALTNIALAPSASFSLPTLATLLIRGFPAMAAATGAAAVIALLRALARR